MTVQYKTLHIADFRRSQIKDKYTTFQAKISFFVALAMVVYFSTFWMVDYLGSWKFRLRTQKAIHLNTCRSILP